MTRSGRLTLSLIFCCLNQAVSEVYYITTNSSDLCTVQPCLTLSQFAANSSHYLHSNTTLVFLPGTYYLSKVNMTLSNVDNFAMESKNSRAQIKCTSDSHIHFNRLQCIHITNLEFIGCGDNQVKYVEEFIVQDSKFEGQKNSGTALEIIETTAQIVNCTFVSNRKGSYREYVDYPLPFGINNVYIGGAIIVTNSVIDISQSEFDYNKANYGGAIFVEQHSIVNMSNNIFTENVAINGEGGALSSHLHSTVTIAASRFYYNNASEGGVLSTYLSSSVTLEESEFRGNSAILHGGVLYSDHSTVTIVGNNTFTKNSSPIGAVIYAAGNSIVQHHNYVEFCDNLSERYAVIYLSNSEFRGRDHDQTNILVFSKNLGSLVAYNSNITFTGYTFFDYNHPLPSTTADFQEGGAITLFQSNAFFDGTCCLQYNHAKSGGAIHSAESKIYVNGNVTIAHNTATGNGGGVYLSTSELNCQQTSTFELFNNTAAGRGGGLQAISSSIKVPSRSLTDTILVFNKNAAERGGGLSLLSNAKLYIFKYDQYNTTTTIFTANTANYGGAVYVADHTNTGICVVDGPGSECFFQVFTLHGLEHPNIGTKSIHFSQNYANISGSTLYGGRLDRCAVSLFAEIRDKHDIGQTSTDIDGETYFKEISTGQNALISSFPVQVCLCVNDEPNCTYQSHIEVKKGEAFTHSVVAVDQIGHPVSAIIRTSLNFPESGLAEGQLTRKTPAECADLTFNVVSPHNSENLTLYASDGPCKDADLSTVTIEIRFLKCSCLIGLQVSGMNNTNCTCECHNDISQYVEQCDGHNGSLVKQPQSRAWISYINDTDQTGYLVYLNCPFDYCLSASPPVNLNQPNGANVQCAFNRSSLLCGSCQPGLSLSLGSSHCLSCPSYWPALLLAITIAAILAGIVLVTLLLVLNMTVAVGTLNGLIFYANIVYANKSILLPFQQTSFITVFISWLNLELGIDTCYFPGMDNYIKTWLQLAFPVYVILLVASVIIISSYSIKFSNLIGKKNPVATLATLILLSFAKLLDICFKSLSVGTLEYPNGSNEMVWLPDATVKYLFGKHIPLFIAAVLILLVGLIYTALLFLWQWLLYLQSWRSFKWSRNSKIQTFIETYHTSYTPKHRYWTGLQLIFRILLYLVAAVNVSNDPRVALTAIIFMVCCSFALRLFFGSRLYGKWPVDILETFFYLNILSFAIFTWYSLNNPDINREAIAYTSVILTFIVLLLLILYHVCTYTSVFIKVKGTKLGRRIDQLSTDKYTKPNPRQQPLSQLPDEDVHRFELLDMYPINTNDHKVSHKKQNLMQPTQSVVDLHQSPQEEVSNTQSDTLGAIEAVQGQGVKEA